MDPNLKILLNADWVTLCSFCGTKLEIGEGIVIQDCLDPFCRDCLTTYIMNSDNVSEVLCPLSPNCRGKLLEREIKQLITSDAFEKIQKKSFEKVFENSPNAFKCKTSDCEGRCITDEKSKVFDCPLCQQINCLECDAIHTDLSCPEYQEEKKKGKDHVQKAMESRKRTGISQLVSCCSEAQTFENLSKEGVIYSTKNFECSICLSDIPAREGIILQECFHVYCKACITSHIGYSDDVGNVKCPTPECKLELLPREVETLIKLSSDPKVKETIERKRWKDAEFSLLKKFHCLTVDCPGFCEIVDNNATEYFCDLCKHKNCIPCNAIHEKQTCADYKNTIQQNVNEEKSLKALENLINLGKAMRCTNNNCKSVIEKTVGCDAIVCTLCRTELCWVTKQARWGPKGKGDTSGGCKCRVNGVPCHPNCRNCH